MALRGTTQYLAGESVRVITHQFIPQTKNPARSGNDKKISEP